jgi:hypothetical protein
MAQAMDHRGCNWSWRTGKKGIIITNTTIIIA